MAMPAFGVPLNMPRHFISAVSDQKNKPVAFPGHKYGSFFRDSLSVPGGRGPEMTALAEASAIQLMEVRSI